MLCPPILCHSRVQSYHWSRRHIVDDMQRYSISISSLYVFVCLCVVVYVCLQLLWQLDIEDRVVDDCVNWSAPAAVNWLWVRTKIKICTCFTYKCVRACACQIYVCLLFMSMKKTHTHTYIYTSINQWLRPYKVFCYCFSPLHLSPTRLWRQTHQLCCLRHLSLWWGLPRVGAGKLSALLWILRSVRLSTHLSVCHTHTHLHLLHLISLLDFKF